MSDINFSMSGDELLTHLTSNVLFMRPGQGAGVPCQELALSDEQMKDWQDAKFGLFIHWGLYAILGHGEWAYFRESIPEEEYVRLADEFKPTRSAQEITDEWIRIAQDAGMRYAVMVTRHHDGFALFNSPSSYKGFTSVNTASGEDYVKAYTNSCHQAGMITGLYYSPLDWRFPGYFHPHEMPENAQALKAQTYGQMEELMSQYGPIDLIWYDGGWLAHSGHDYDSAWLYEPIKLNQMVRSYNPNVIVNPRSGYEGNFKCDEGNHIVTGDIIPLPWEKCMSISEHAWGYIPDDGIWSFEFLIHQMVAAITRGGNFLLNVGPDRNGYFPEKAVARLQEIGAWMRVHGEAVYGTRAGIFDPVDNVFGSVHKDNCIYLHVLDPEAFNKLTLPVPRERILDCTLLDGEPVFFMINDDRLSIQIPFNEKYPVDTVIKITCDAPVTPLQ